MLIVRSWALCALMLASTACVHDVGEGPSPGNDATQPGTLLAPDTPLSLVPTGPNSARVVFAWGPCADSDGPSPGGQLHRELEARGLTHSGFGQGPLQQWEIVGAPPASIESALHEIDSSGKVRCRIQLPS
jgi:hypothetical protein